MCVKICTHFVGFRGDEYNRAILVFGEPDFVHKVHDGRMYEEIDKENDVVIFGSKPNFKKHNWDASSEI